MASVEVFVDDAVRGRLPDVCAKTGTTADGRFRIEDHRGGIGVGWLLLLLGPLGWIVLVVMAITSRREVLTIRLPYSREAVDREVRLARARLIGLVAMVACAVGTFFAASHFGSLAVALCAAFLAGMLVATVVAHVRLVYARVGIRLDASRRWVTLLGVHPLFVDAVRERSARESMDTST